MNPSKLLLLAALTASAAAQDVKPQLVTTSMEVSSSLPDAPEPSEAYTSALIQPAKAPAAKRTRFFTPVMLSLIGADGLVRTVDAFSTRANLTNPCHCYKEDNVPSLMKTNTSALLYSEGVVALYTGTAYLLHRMHHDRLAKLPLAFDVAYDGKDAFHNIQIAGRK